MNRKPVAMADRLPVNLDAERMILGAVTIDKGWHALHEALKHVSAGDFFQSEHKIIFREFLKMFEAKTPINIVTLVESLYSHGDADAAGGAPYIASLADGMPRVSDVESYARIVQKKSALRQLAHFGEKLTREAMEPRADLPALQEQMRALAVTAEMPTSIGGNGHLSYSLFDFMAADFPKPEHLVEVVNDKQEVIGGLIPQNSTVMIFSMPHHLKSFFTTSLAMACTKPGIKFGKLLVNRPVRTLLIQMEDFPGQLQDRIRRLAPGIEINYDFLRILPRCDHKGNKIDITLPNTASVAAIKREIEDFQAEHVIFDVLRRIVNVDLNSQKDSAEFLEQMDGFRYCPSAPTLTLVHHENRKEADIMYASAGSYNLPGWANVMIQFKRKREENGVSHVEIECDNKLAQSPEPMRMVLDFGAAVPLRLENIEDSSGVQELRDQLGIDWTVRDLMEVLGVHKSNAIRRMKKMLAGNVIEKLIDGKRGRQGGLARYRFVGEGAE